MPIILLENDGLVYLGEPATKSSIIPSGLAEKMLESRNPHGKPNADVLRQFVTCTDSHRPAAHWQIDFPPDMHESEAALYAQPFAELRRRNDSSRARWWVNPLAQPDLRAALARRDRYLASQLKTKSPGFQWLESSLIPDATLVVIARDDDFAHGVLSSRFLALWWAHHHSPSNPTVALNSFPFPWPVQTSLSSLTAAQEEQRHAVAKAARADDIESINATMAAAYGWPEDLSDDETLGHLKELNRLRAPL